MRLRVSAYLKEKGYPDGGPTNECLALYWIMQALYFVAVAAALKYGTILSILALGLVTSWAGAFGHNWVHQPKYKWMAYLCLDIPGFSSDMWFRDHNLQHHMYTNTPWDNHYHGTDPFLVTEPTKPRAFLQKWVSPFLNPLILSFGVIGNYTAHTVELIKGNEKLTPWKVLFPIQIVAFMYVWGPAWGGLLCYINTAFIGIYYFTCALMNHNAEHITSNVDKRNAARDWGEAQLHSSADWDVESSFYRSFLYLCLNYHTVHHLFPRVCMSHH